MDFIELISKSVTFDIIKALLTNKKMYGKQFEDFIGKKGSVRVRLKELESLGIIASEVEDKFQGKKWYWLTEKGRKVAEHLVEIERIMGGR